MEFPRWCLFFVVLSSSLSTFSCDTLTKTNSIDRRKQDDIEDQNQSSSSRCSSCLREDVKNRNIEAIREELLMKLGMDKPPNMTGRVIPKLPDDIFQIYKTDNMRYGWQNDEPEYQTETEEDDEFHMKAEKIITFAQPYNRIRHFSGHDILHFPFSQTITKYRVSNASLYVFVKGSTKNHQAIATLEVFKLVKHEAVSSEKVLTRKIMLFGKDEWHKLDVSVMVSEWFKNPDENLGFILNGTVDGKKISLHNKDAAGGMPYVEISVSETKRRIRRQNLNCDERSAETICCRYPLTIDFETFGWDFIIAPKKYDAHYCSGECTYMSLQKNPHTHLAILALPQSAVPCCAPRKLSSINMLYFDQDYNVLFGSLPGMVVDRCGCS